MHKSFRNPKKYCGAPPAITLPVRARTTSPLSTVIATTEVTTQKTRLMIVVKNKLAYILHATDCTSVFICICSKALHSKSSFGGAGEIQVGLWWRGACEQ